MTPHVVAGIDIGGTGIAGVVVTRYGEVLASMTVPARTERGGLAVLGQIPPLVSELETLAGAKVSGVGVGAAGVIEAGTGQVLVASRVFQDWVGHRLAVELGDSLGLPVTVANDVNAFLLGELKWGVLQDVQDALGVMLGTGVGGAIALRGRLVEGSFGGAGEIGHTPRYSDHICTCGGIGHLETVTSGRSLALRYSERTGGNVVTGQEVTERARAGEGAARAVINAAGWALADALLAATTLLDISHVVVGGGVVTGAWDLLSPAVTSRILDNPPVSGRGLSVRSSRLTFPALGAATLALNDSLPDPRREVS